MLVEGQLGIVQNFDSFCRPDLCTLACVIHAHYLNLAARQVIAAPKRLQIPAAEESIKSMHHLELGVCSHGYVGDTGATRRFQLHLLQILVLELVTHSDGPVLDH